MGERKGQNKYYPPDYDPRAGGLNKFLGTHALRERARKLDQGILIIRFEMPYNIWCDGCQNHIGMGVRYNAEKKKVGMYYTTPVYQFRMKCHLCENHFEIKTDPGNLDYVILSGARRQENRWDPTQNGQVVPDDKEMQKRLFDDAMFKLEHSAKDLATSAEAKPALGRLFERNEDVWRDPYEANSRLRAEFRTKKKELKVTEEIDKTLLAKSSLDIDLVPENDEDRHMASLMCLQTVKSSEEEAAERRQKAINRPSLPGSTVISFGGIRAEKLLSKKLNPLDLGIRKRPSTSPAATETNEGISQNAKKSKEHYQETQKTPDCAKEAANSVAKASENVQTAPKTAEEAPKGISLVGDYSSSGTESDT
ncbi:coiled-coil domain-containing protein 130 homolog [Lutzomyia longipalpis]|uniref:coiled-coil domain-containing protein 130 homolog n=1 Tax=Lutzomyia longipalpis TaxID=7200 RepID=UPI00248365B4|nr:coiled-coil domain-containing protein 130 homolog [Lutzomyia longipalpis]